MRVNVRLKVVVQVTEKWKWKRRRETAMGQLLIAYFLLQPRGVKQRAGRGYHPVVQSR